MSIIDAKIADIVRNKVQPTFSGYRKNDKTDKIDRTDCTNNSDRTDKTIKTYSTDS